MPRDERRDLDLLEDIDRAAARIERFAGSTQKQDFVRDALIISAVARRLGDRP